MSSNLRLTTCYYCTATLIGCMISAMTDREDQIWDYIAAAAMIAAVVGAAFMVIYGLA